MIRQTFASAAVRYKFMTFRTLADKAADGVDAVTSTTQHWVA